MGTKIHGKTKTVQHRSIPDDLQRRASAVQFLNRCLRKFNWFYWFAIETRETRRVRAIEIKTIQVEMFQFCSQFTKSTRPTISTWISCAKSWTLPTVFEEWNRLRCHIVIYWWNILIYLTQYSLCYGNEHGKSHFCTYIIMWLSYAVLTWESHGLQVHFILFLTEWTIFTFEINAFTGGQPWLFGLLNCFVHVIMYSYYYGSVYSPKLKTNLFIKRSITQLQIVSFFYSIKLFFRSRFFFQNFFKVLDFKESFFCLVKEKKYFFSNRENLFGK